MNKISSFLSGYGDSNLIFLGLVYTLTNLLVGVLVEALTHKLESSSELHRAFLLVGGGSSYGSSLALT